MNTKRTIILRAAALLPCLLLVLACQEEQGPEETTKNPVQTKEAQDVTMDAATLYAQVDPDFDVSGASFGFLVSMEQEPTEANSEKVIAQRMDGQHVFFVQVTNLSRNSFYFFRAFVQTPEKFWEGEVKYLETPWGILPVDIGLNVRWGDFNVGTTANDRKGESFLWGETDPKKESGWQNYKWVNNSVVNGEVQPSLLKYNYDPEYGVVDFKYVLDPEDDAACVKLGGSWRMPTKEETEALIDTKFDPSNYEWNKKKVDGIVGWEIVYLVNGNSVFFPDAYYWSASLGGGTTPFWAEGFCFMDDNGITRLGATRNTKCMIRAVTP